MQLTASDWPISAALLQFPSRRIDGTDAQRGDPDVWRSVFREVADAGFDHLDLTDSWVRPGDLSATQLDEFAGAANAENIDVSVISVARRSVIDPIDGVTNLAYAHRTIEAAAHLQVSTVCLGLHRPLTELQRKQLWFWTVEGARDADDQQTWDLAVARFAELGAHAADLGIVLSLELYEDTLLGTADSAVRLITDIDRSNVGLNPDIGNLVRLHRRVEDWREIAAKTLPYANYWQVKNYARDEDPSTGAVSCVPSYLEIGFIDYREAVRMALSSGFQGVICTEHYGGDGLSVSAANREYLRRILPQRADYRAGTSLVDQPSVHTGVLAP
jgi:sugar phosphate isomerase/epimerase